MTGEINIIRIQPSEMKSEFVRILLKYGFTQESAEKCSEIFTVNTLEGVASHGINRFPRFINNVRDGYVKPGQIPVFVHGAGALEQWDGRLGPGPLNAVFATDRAVEIAASKGIGLVALANTNHWMRGGTYGWHAAKKGYIFIGWTNTEANMPAWGAEYPRLGNNPLIFALPFKDEAIVLDFAMTQFSYGKMESYKMSGEKLPFPGGFNKNGELTTDPEGILETRRTLPIGYWKGAGLSLLLDLLAVVLSGGKSVSEITKAGTEHALSQVFIAINPQNLSNFRAIDETIGRVIADFRQSIPSDGKTQVRYPGENILKQREINSQNGIPVSSEIWQKVINL